MQYYSLNKQAPKVSFKTAVTEGIAPDKGLYFPESIPVKGGEFWKGLYKRDIYDIAQELMQPFTGNSVPEDVLYEILQETLSFDFPLVTLGKDRYALELYHGPTMAFKDVGSRFMAQCLGFFSEGKEDTITVLVATSGDTGGAVARGFLGVEGVEVVILYPEGKVSEIQERQLTTLEQNIRALKVQGSFDDCQAMVKRAFLDPDLNQSLNLTSANSINVARWLPQMLYYVIAVRHLGDGTPAPVFSVPSGNFGNICAGMMAHAMGMPCRQFIAATNVNDTVPRFMDSEQYHPEPTIPTISNAMDVSDPSNWVRILELFQQELPLLRQKLTALSFSDEQTREAMRSLQQDYGYTADPHGAVGYLGLEEALKDHPGSPGIFLETAHPIKFRPEVESTLGIRLDIPDQIQAVLEGEMKALSVVDYEEVKSFLLRDSSR